MATQAKYLPLPGHSPKEYVQPTHALAPIDRAVACLDEAMAAQETDEDTASPEALGKARELLIGVSFWVDSIPDPAAIFSLDKGVEVAWKNENRHVRLFCAPPTSKSYIYLSSTNNNKTEFSVMWPSNVLMLADGLQWLLKGDQPAPASRH